MTLAEVEALAAGGESETLELHRRTGRGRDGGMRNAEPPRRHGVVRLWNPLIARVFYLRGIIEQWGRGTIKMRELVTGAGLPAPEIEDAGGCVTVRFRPGTYVPSRVEREVTDRQQAILAVLAGVRDGLALREITSRLDNSPTQRQVQDDLRILRTLGLAMSTGHGRGARWKRE